MCLSICTTIRIQATWCCILRKCVPLRPRLCWRMFLVRVSCGKFWKKDDVVNWWRDCPSKLREWKLAWIVVEKKGLEWCAGEANRWLTSKNSCFYNYFASLFRHLGNLLDLLPFQLKLAPWGIDPMRLSATSIIVISSSVLTSTMTSSVPCRSILPRTLWIIWVDDVLRVK